MNDVEELKKKIVQLEERIRTLESRPVAIIYPQPYYPQPYYPPTYPFWTITCKS